MPFLFKKTGVIGIGGTGMHTVLYMKKKLLETYGEIPPMIKFLVIDTTDKELLETQNGEVKLEPGEFIKLELQNPKSLIETSKEVKEWIPENIPMFALNSGAKQIRALGRLAVFANAHPLEAKIDGLISSLRDFRVGRYEGKFELFSDNIIINIVCSLSGGTGSGAFLDVAVLAKKNLTTTDRLIGYFLLPDVFLSKPATYNVEQNAYAALKEINYFFTEEGKYTYYLGGRERRISGELFNAVYLINNINTQGIEYKDDRDLKEFLGMGILLQSSSVGKAGSDILDNLEGILISRKWFGKPTVFSSFGIGELIYPGDWFADLYAKKIALNIIQKTFIGGNVSNVNEFTDDFIQRVGIKEHEADDVINAILVPGDFPKFPLPPDFRKEMVAITIGRRETHLNEVQKYILRTSRENLEKFKIDKIKSLVDEIINRLSTPQGLEFCKNFLNCLVGRLIEFRNEMNYERDEFKKMIDDLKPKYDVVRSEAEKASKAIFNARVRIEEALKKFKQLVDKESSLMLEVERRECAIDFFSSLIDEINRWLQRLQTFSSYCDILIQELNQEIQQKHTEKREIKPFMLEIKPSNLTEEAPFVEPYDFLRWLGEDKNMTIANLIEMRISEIKDILLEYAYHQKRVREVKETKIDDILKNLSPEERMKYITRLDKMASPLWQYDRGLIAGDKKTENIYIFGVEDPNNTVFVPEEISKAIESPYPPSIIGTGDPKRILCLKIESPLPLFVIYNVQRYREKYLDPRKPFSYHIHKNWERELPDLFPGTEKEEARKYWSLALAEPFNLIIKIGEYYYVRSEKKGKKLDDFKVKLAQGRIEAMKVFLEDSELIEETKENIERIVRDLGNKKVAESLRAYTEKIERESKRYGKDIREQLELELKDIEDYINSILEP